MSRITKAAMVSLTLGITTIATAVGTAKQASALPVLDVLQVPLNAVLGRPQTPQPPTRSTDLQLMNGNLNGNNLTLCTLTCGLPGLPGSSGAAPVRPTGAPPSGISPNGVPVGLPPNGGMAVPPGARPAAPVANRTQASQPSLLLPPIPLPNPF